MTSAQENFAREVAAGKSQADAYREAFPKSCRWTEKALHTRASALAKSAEVLRRVEELRREADAEAIMDCRELRLRLTKRLRALDEAGASAAEFCKVADCLARVSGWMTPQALAVAVAPIVERHAEESMRRLYGG